MNTHSICIAIVAPSGYTLDDAAVNAGIAQLQARGHKVVNYFDTAGVFQRFGGSDASRLAQLEAAAANPEVQVVMALRGQYGLTRLLERIDFARMAASGKIFVGFSDFTAFGLAMLAKTGACSYAGPMLLADFAHAALVDFTVDDFFHCLAGPTHAIGQQASGNPALDVSGTIWGGNLAMLMSLLGTEFFPHVDDGILFLEDVNEHPYRVERMLLQLMQAGVLARQQAVVLGDFSAYTITAADNGYDVDAMVAYLRAVLPCPVLTGLEFGHGRRRVTIPVGARAHLQSNGGQFTIAFSDYPSLGAILQHA